MTDQTELATLVAEIAVLVREGGHADRADWLEERLVALRDPGLSEAELARISSELHGIVLGMGGLMDLELTVGASSSETAGSARARLDDLADRLYEATR